LGLRCFVAVLRFMCEGPCLLGILRAYKATENFGRGRVGGGRGAGFQHSLAGLRSASLPFDQFTSRRRTDQPTRRPSLSMSNCPSSLWNGPGGKRSSRSRTASLGRHRRTPLIFKYSIKNPDELVRKHLKADTVGRSAI
jgi:hypothetical protein